MLALTDVKNSSACKHHCSSSNTFRHERAISERMQAILLGASSKGLNCRRGKNERAAVLAAKDQRLMMFDKMHGDVQAKLMHRPIRRGYKFTSSNSRIRDVRVYI